MEITWLYTRSSKYFLKLLFFQSNKFNRQKPLKATICLTSITKLAVGRVIRGKNHKLFLCFRFFFLTHSHFNVQNPTKHSSSIKCQRLSQTWFFSRLYIQSIMFNIITFNLEKSYHRPEKIDKNYKVSS